MTTPDKPLTDAELAEIDKRAPYHLSPTEIDRLLSHARLRDTEVSSLASKVYQPGVFRCAKCNFQLVQKSLNAHDGSVTARDAVGEKCPNDGSPMWRVSYQEDNAKAWEWGEEQFNRARDAEAEVSLLRAQVQSAAEGAQSLWSGEASLLRGEVERLRAVLIAVKPTLDMITSNRGKYGAIATKTLQLGHQVRAALASEG